MPGLDVFGALVGRRRAGGHEGHICAAVSHGRFARWARRTTTFLFASEDEAARAVREVRTRAVAGEGTLHLIVNPHSGSGRGLTVLRETVLPMLKAAGVPSDVHTTTKPLDAAEFAQKLPLHDRRVAVAACELCGPRRDAVLHRQDDCHSRRGVRAIVVVGGDGTLHEVLQGLLARPDWQDARRVPLALVGTGSGNGTCVSSGVSSPVAAVHAVIKGRSEPLDVFACYDLGPSPTGAVQARLLRFGMLSLTTALVATADLGSESLRWMGPLRFTVGAVKDILAARRYPLDVFVTTKRGSSSPRAARETQFQGTDWNEVEALYQTHSRRVAGAGDLWGEAGAAVPESGGLSDVGAVVAAAASQRASENGLPLADLSQQLLARGRDGAATLPDGWRRVPQVRFPVWGVFNQPWITSDVCACPGQSFSSGSISTVSLGEGVTRRQVVNFFDEAAKGTTLSLPYVSKEDVGGVLLLPRKPGQPRTALGWLRRRCQTIRHACATAAERRGDAKRTWISLDGEDIGVGPTYVEVHPRLCRIIVPPDWAPQ